MCGNVECSTSFPGGACAVPGGVYGSGRVELHIVRTVIVNMKVSKLSQYAELTEFYISETTQEYVRECFQSSWLKKIKITELLIISGDVAIGTKKSDETRVLNILYILLLNKNYDCIE